MSQRPPVILIGMDATQITLIDQLVEAGRMPVLAELRRRGRMGRLQTRPTQFLSMVWPTFFSSQSLGHHGWYFNKVWRCEKQQLGYVNREWLPTHVFWEGLDPSLRVAVLDLPYSDEPRCAYNGVYLNGWQCHDDFGNKEHPAGLRADLESRHGRALLSAERFGPQDARNLLDARREALETNDQFANLCVDLLKRERWDLFLAVFGAAHRGAHYLWDLSQIDENELDEQTRATLRNARDDCYVSWDAALGKIVDAAPKDAWFMVFALHGMEASDGWFESMQRIVEQIHRGGGAAAPPKKGLTYRLKKALPWRLVRQVTRRIPHSWNQALVPLWSRRMYDWASTRYFALPVDFNGYIRLNLRGREREGIVDPANVAAVYAEIREALLSFRDLETGEPVVSDVIPVDSIVGADAPRRFVLPDLVVKWARRHASRDTSGIVSEKYGEVRWTKGGKYASGRSGNHTPDGWFVVTGPGLSPGRCERTHDAVDLMPTVFEWMAAKRPEFFQGRPIEELLPNSPNRV